MSRVSLTPAQVKAHVAAISDRYPAAMVIGIRADEPWDGPARLAVGDEEVEVARCVSVLQICDLLSSRPEQAARLVVITPLADRDLGSDVLARFARRRLLRPEPWSLVMEAFKARDLDSRLLGHRWMAEALLQAMPPEGYTPVPAGVLDRDTAWGVVLSTTLGLESPRADAVALLRWATQPSSVERYRALSDDARRAVRDWVEQSSGAGGAVMLDCLEGSGAADVLALGLTCAVLFAQASSAGTRLREAAVRLERFVGGRPLDRRAAEAWADAGARVLREWVKRDDRPSLRAAIGRADVLLTEMSASEWAYLSDYSLRGLEQRIDRFGTGLADALNDGADGGALTTVATRLAAVQEHCLVGWQPERKDRLAMSLRLAQWLATPNELAGSFDDAVRGYAEQEGLVDWARTQLQGGDPSSAAQAAMDQLRQLVFDRREHQNARFAQLLADWVRLSGSGRALTTERVLDDVVAPCARSAPVLLLVLDGMSVAVCRELLTSVGHDGWVPVGQASGLALQPVVAAFPTVTEVCRASLFAGALTRGVATAERSSFSGHPALAAESRSTKPPVLYHKGQLTDERGNLDEEVARELESPERRVVGIVVNAVDDHLLKADQVRHAWTLDFIQMLRPVLHAARSAGRLVVLTSDHGHVLDETTEAIPAGQSDRYRSGDATVDGEIELAGPRVLSDGHHVIAAWSERLRYRSAKNGYHGGASLQEVVVPLVVLASAESILDTWHEQPMTYPEWWDVAATLAPVEAPPVEVMAEPVGRSQTPLFDLADQAEAAAASSWIDRLLATAVFRDRLAAAGRVAIGSERIHAILSALNERGGTMTRSALAAKVGVHTLRLGGQLESLRHLLNIDGYAVLSIDEAADSVQLNRELLKTQFEL